MMLQTVVRSSMAFEVHGTVEATTPGYAGTSGPSASKRYTIPINYGNCWAQQSDARSCVYV
jgi:hypothetical protein